MAPPKSAAEDRTRSNIRYPFWFGGSASSMAACVTHPLDLGDAPRTMSGTFVRIARDDGLAGLYSGISASLLRQLTYSTVRFGLYEEMKTRYQRRRRQPPSFPALTAMAVTSGFLGGVAGNFADVLNVRMQHDAALPPRQRRNYRNAVDGLVRMVGQEGPAACFRGWLPNSCRAAVMTAGQLATYDAFKRLLIRYTPMADTLSTHLSASFLAGLAAATATSPIDVIKTRVMSSSQDQGIFRLVGDIYKTDGFRWMFKGWLPSFLRLGPQTICTFVFLEMHRNAYRRITDLTDEKQL
ncbi:hypothetical protein L249_4225 [Ophiocordyceps polyrhachis-furcata BCC 54312]|uniref:Mitochondrial dicarboxylate carrier n=1 Tax=Ophiocordyceps polyrhachis-furcata BCC 54312 TaxID=1330021 RepID=A0A367LBX0_9HYPO|nr:hypothetical protein L249_4225 [Ophiocordyceps polyrhachis-furcata BCC 54312]